MFDHLKRQTLVRLTLAIAGGYVLAHFVMRSADYFYEYELNSKPTLALTVLVALGVISLLSYRFGKQSLGFLRNHWRPAAVFSMLLAAGYLAITYRAMQREAKLQVAHRAYADEYSRRFSQFQESHVGATQEDFLSYDADPKALYGYAKILKNMKADGSLFDPKKLGITSNQNSGCENRDDSYAKSQCQSEEDEIAQLVKETGLDEQTIRWNFNSIRKRNQQREHLATWNPMLARQLTVLNFAAIPYEDEYMKNLGDITDPSPELERSLYDQIVLGGRKKSTTLDFSHITPSQVR